MSSRHALLWIIMCLVSICTAFAQVYPDQHYVLRIDSLFNSIETNDGMTLSGDGKSVVLQPDRTNGYIIVKPQTSAFPFNHGLPSWNGSAPDNSSAFKIQIRFPYGSGWSPWLTVGFWKANVWTSYGSTSYVGGIVDYDYVKLNSYVRSWQFKIIMTRTTVGQVSPAVHKLSFFVSDSRTTTSLDFNQIVSDRPGPIFIPTDFIYQYGVDPDIGGNICSPTSVSMVLRSYDIAVDPLEFARATRDPYYDMFGIWPRVVQNASEYRLDGAVTRYRGWSQARDVLANGGRIVMSVGPPLYEGHLMMLAGFTPGGDPIVHDPARSNGYGYVFNKTDLSYSWFDKGGVAYTFFPADSQLASEEQPLAEEPIANEFRLFQNYPNPFNPTTVLSFQLPTASDVRLVVYDVVGREVATLVNEVRQPGIYTVEFDGSNLASGVYLCRFQAREIAGRQASDFTQTKRLVLLR